jgi:hypothetical protein
MKTLSDRQLRLVRSISRRCIVMRSDAEADLAETLLKADAQMQAIDQGANPHRALKGAAPVKVGGPDNGS